MGAAPDEDLVLAARFMAEERWLDAQAACHRVLNRVPDQPDAFQILGLIARQNGLLALAADLFRRSAEIHPKGETFRNLGLVLDERGLRAEAFNAYRQAIATEPTYAEAYNAVGYLYAEDGQAREATRSFERALELKPGLVMAIENLIPFLPLDRWIGFCNRGMEEPGLAEFDRYTLLVNRAIAEWALGQYEGLGTSLSAALPHRPARGCPDTRLAGLRAFDILLAALLKFRAARPAEFRLDPATKIYGIGDSHLLSYANTPIVLGGKEFRVSADWILSINAWQVIRGTANRHATAFRQNLESAPENALVVCSFGEIDCRFNQGIMAHWKKAGGDLEAIVLDQVDRYVSDVARLVRRNRLRLLFLTTPAPHVNSAGPAASVDDRKAHARIAQAFNRNLMRLAVELGHGFIDTYGLTAGEDGYGRPAYYLDAHHLRPDLLARATIFTPRLDA